MSDSGVVSNLTTSMYATLSDTNPGTLVQEFSDDLGVLFQLKQPIGTLLPYAGTTLPDNFLWCDGGSYSFDSASVYLNLYNIIKNTYNNSATPSGYFSVPDLRSRFPIGSASTSTIGVLYNSATIVSGGESTITTDQMPSHTHTLSTHTHTLSAHTHTGPSHSHLPPAINGADSSSFNIWVTGSGVSGAYKLACGNDCGYEAWGSPSASGASTTTTASGTDPTGAPSVDATGVPSADYTGIPSADYTGIPSGTDTGAPSADYTGAPSVDATGNAGGANQYINPFCSVNWIIQFN